MPKQNKRIVYITRVEGLTAWEKLRQIDQFIKNCNDAIDNNAADDETLDDLAFLEKYRAKLLEKAEETRIPGKTDKEMFELNHILEEVERVLFDARAEIIAYGRIDKATAKLLLRNPWIAAEGVRRGILNPSILQHTGIPISYIGLDIDGLGIDLLPKISRNIIETKGEVLDDNMLQFKEKE